MVAWEEDYQSFQDRPEFQPSWYEIFMWFSTGNFTLLSSAIFENLHATLCKKLYSYCKVEFSAWASNIFDYMRNLSLLTLAKAHPAQGGLENLLMFLNSTLQEISGEGAKFSDWSTRFGLAKRIGPKICLENII